MIPVNGVVCEKLSSLLVERMQRSSELRGGLNEGSNAVLCIRQAYVWLYARIAVQSFSRPGRQPAYLLFSRTGRSTVGSATVRGVTTVSLFWFPMSHLDPVGFTLTRKCKGNSPIVSVRSCPFSANRRKGKKLGFTLNLFANVIIVVDLARCLFC